jgi:CubicO group peptidase (beta-lactamase class C family)
MAVLGSRLAVLMVVVASALPAPPATAAAQPASIPNTVAPDASPRFRAVGDAVMQAMQAAQVPGVSIGIRADGREEVAGFGVTSVETREPVTAETRFQVGSITKTYTATALMRLVDQGRVDLDAPVRTYLPDFRVVDPDVSARVTVRNLLAHTGGWWGDSITDTGDGPDALATFVDQKMPSFPQLAPLGEYVTYNNSGLLVAGRIIEVVTGQTYRDAMHDLLLGPLGLEQSTFDPQVVLAGPHSEGHAATADGPRVQHPPFIPRNAEPAGGLSATAADVLRYARFQMGDGAGLLRPETLRRMQSPQAPPPAAGDRVGFTWFVHTRGTPAFQHTGGTYGQASLLEVLPEQGLALVVLTNLQPTAENGHSGGDVIGAALRATLETYLPGGIAAYVGPTPPVEAPPSLSAADLAAYAGEYGVPDLHVRLAQEDGGAVLYSTPIDLPDQVQLAIKAPINTPLLPARAALTFTAADAAVVVDPATGVATPLFFVRTPDGRVGWFSVGGVLLFPRERNTP